MTVPGALTLSVQLAANAGEGEASGLLVLKQGANTRRVPYWLRVVNPQLRKARVVSLARPGTYHGDTTRGAALVSEYRYPENPAGVGVTRVLPGPERVFRVRLRRPVANFGVAVLTRAPGVRVQPRVVAAGDENRLTGDAGLPLVLNPFLSRYQQPALVAGAIRPAAGTYDVVFDGPSRKAAGRFTFRFWVDDIKPPTLRLLRRTIATYSLLPVKATDGGSGIDPASVVARIDGRATPASYDSRTGQVLVLIGIRAGQAHAVAAGLRLPGDQEHGERLSGAAEHDDADQGVRRAGQLAGPAERRLSRPERQLELVALLDRRQAGEVALDAGCEVVLVVERVLGDDAEVRAPTAALPLSVRCERQ